MHTEQILGRLAIHIDSLQEGFELLSQAPTVKEMSRRLFHVLRGNLTAVQGHIFFRPSGEPAWQKLYGRGTAGLDDIEAVGAVASFSVRTPTGGDLPLLALQPLLDGSSLAVFFGRRLARRSSYTEQDRISLRMFLQLFANAYQAYLQRRKEKELIFSLNHRLLQLNSLIDTGIALSRLSREHSLHQIALQRAAALTNAARGSVKISAGRKVLERIVFPEGSRTRARVPPDRRIRASFRFLDHLYMFELAEKESRKGMCPFEETDRLLLESLARQVHAVLEIHHFHAQEVERQKMERELAVAASIQQRILPASLPRIDGYDLHGVNIPTKHVGGDYYDCIPLRDGRYMLVMADVAGKGVPAALLVSSFHASLSAFLETSVSLVELVQRLNTVIYRASTEERYITAVVAIVDPATGEMESTNAGHTPMYLLRHSGAFEELGNGGLAMGMMDLELPYETDRVVLDRGDRLLLFTDGVTEAMNAAGALYDEGGSLRAFMAQTRPERSELFIQALLDDIRRFVGPAPQADDITAMYLMRSG